jgi:ABC-type spermidine/putrescine transport system permease subunit II
MPRLLGAYAGGFYAFLYVPIAVMVVLSFNDSEIMGFPLKGFTLRWYGAAFAGNDLLGALFNSFAVGIFASIIATALALMIALGLRHRVPFREAVLPVILIPIITPGIVSGVLLYVSFGIVGLPYGLSTAVLAAHVTWVLPFAFLTLYPRLHRFDRSIEEAAMDLGATPWVVFRRVVLPLIRPAIIATVLFSFTLSFDEFIRTFFVIGNENTLPMYLWSMIMTDSTPQTSAVGSVIVAFSLTWILLGHVFFRK